MTAAKKPRKPEAWVPRPEGEAYNDPGLYGLRLGAMPADLAPQIKSGDLALVSPTAPLTRGHWVIIQGKGETATPLLFKLLKEPLWLPHQHHPESTAVPFVELEGVDGKDTMVAIDQLSHIHAVIGFQRADGAK